MTKSKVPKTQYAPPPHPPPKKPLLQPTSNVQYSIDLEQLASQGWTTLPISNLPSDSLYSAYSELFTSSSQFFNLLEDERCRYKVPPREVSQVSEEGYSRIPGEKCMITLRKSETTPTEYALREKAEAAWSASGKVMHDVLVVIEESLGMKSGMLVRAADDQLALPPEGMNKPIASLMRLFRYDRPLVSPDAESTSRVVSEPHKDLGLLTIVVGHTPGLECWDAAKENWVPCETREGLNATILVGQTLAKFTNWRFAAGRHRVFVDPQLTSVVNPDSPVFDGSYRYSIVHALRGHFPVRVSHAEFETSVTGRYTPATQFNDVSISDIYHAISDAHWNVNISIEERRLQEQILLDKAEREQQERMDAEHILSSANFREYTDVRMGRSSLRTLFGRLLRRTTVK